MYKITLTLQGDPNEYVGEGETMLQAFLNLKPPMKLMAKAWIKATDGSRFTELWMMPAKLRRFLRPVARAYQANALLKNLR